MDAHVRRMRSVLYAYSERCSLIPSYWYVAITLATSIALL